MKTYTPEQLWAIDAKVAQHVTKVKPWTMWYAAHEDEPDGALVYMERRFDATFPTKLSVERWIKEHPVAGGKNVVLMSLDIYPEYTTSFGAMGEVLEKMLHEANFGEYGGMIDVSIRFNPYDQVWQVEFDWSSHVPVRADHASLPIAVALASLKAKGVEV